MGFQRAGWPREIRLLRGQENKWACQRRDVSCLRNTNAYSKYVAPRQAFVFGIKSLDLLLCAAGTRARQCLLHAALRFKFPILNPKGSGEGFPWKAPLGKRLRLGKGANASTDLCVCVCVRLCHAAPQPCQCLCESSFR